MARLKVYMGADPVQELRIEKDVVTVGRSRSADLCLDNVLVSREHARFVRERGVWRVEDLSGKNGVYVNGDQVQRRALRNQDKVEMGKYLIIFCLGRDEQERDIAMAARKPGAAYKQSFDELVSQVDGEPAARTYKKTGSQVDAVQETLALSDSQMDLIRTEMDKRRKPHFKALSEMSAKVFHLQKATMTLGRSPECDIVLKGFFGIGKLHARLTVSCDQCVIEHQSGFAGMKVNGQKQQSWVLKDGDVVELGGNKLKFSEGL